MDLGRAGGPDGETQAQPAHPYYPPGVSMPHFHQNEDDLVYVLAMFGGLAAAVVVGAWKVSAWSRVAGPGLKSWDRFCVCWFGLCGFLHCFFEGYFILNHDRLASQQTIFAQAWKEYALSDSRYLTSDPFMICVESVTVFVWGPLCWSIAAAIVSRSPLRHPLQIIMCVGHLYGVALYYSTSLTESAMTGTMHSRPEFLYFWVYYVGFNGPWVVVPLILLCQSLSGAKKAFGALQREETAAESAKSR